MANLNESFAYSVFMFFSLVCGALSQKDNEASMAVTSSKERVLHSCNSSCIANNRLGENNGIRIDLKNVYKISSVIINYLNTGCCNVEISKTLDAPHCAKGTSTSAEGLSSFRVDSSQNPSLQDSRYIDIDSLNSHVKEIQVLGECPDNYCGTSCTEFCFCKTPLTTEEKEAGVNCHDGCKEGWSGQRCEKRRCLGSHKMIGFGLGCRYQCKCIWEQCDPWTGECLGPDRRCIIGRGGPSCQKILCSPGTFGPECYFQCHCSNNSPCNTVDGACPGSCETGWERKACDEKCSPGTFGENCTGRCHCSDDEPCDHVTGICSNGCSDGWVGSKCNQPCPAGKFGENCLYDCGNCLNNTACNHINGSCFSGCQKGWPVPMCKVEGIFKIFYAKFNA